MSHHANPMEPDLATITGIRDLATGIKLFQVKLNDPEASAAFDYAPGQFAEVSAFGVGESPFGITSTRERGETIEFAVNRIGTVTEALHRMDVGDVVGLRGPLGNSFPMEAFKGEDVVILGGGIGGAPLRPVIETIIDHRADYGKLTVFWAARSPDLLVFTDEYDDWRAQPDTELHLTVDRATPDWPHKEGLITTLVEAVGPSSNNAVSITCGPPIMIKFAMLTLQKLGFTSSQNWVTLEAKMKCGIGKCGRCNMGGVFVCTDGPVFCFEEVEQFLESFV
ncbi:MAG TPA: FAD/NAD(P)-binding protein [Anaerolineae bacterium]|nr:FAD/NAD(P)-binding protein [Anaerolineae bacterium]